MTEVVITGVGVALPGTPDPDRLWDHVEGARSALGPISAFDASGYTTDRAGVLDAETEARTIGTIKPRLRKRMDRFCQLAVAATDAAIADAGIDPGDDPEQTGVAFGNMFGGWEITEPSLRGLYERGYMGVSPYIASAWFPTAPQGQVSIGRGLKGFAKTTVADTASSALAIGYAGRAITAGRANVVLAGGVEAPLTPYTYTFCETSGRLSPTTYRPLDDRADGFQVGEGAAVLALEDAGSAARRGAAVHAVLRGFALGHCPEPDALTPAGEQALAHTIGAALEQAGVAGVDCVIADGQARTEADKSELAAIRSVVGEVPVTTPKGVTGHLLGAASAVDAVTAVLAMRHGVVPPTTGCERPVDDLVVTAPLHGRVRTVLMLARGADGTCAATVLQSP